MKYKFWILKQLKIDKLKKFSPPRHIKILKGEGAKIATVIFKMDNFGTRNFDGAKPDIINQNGTNLELLNIGVKFDR